MKRFEIALRGRSARSLFTRAARRPGEAVAPDIDRWFQEDRFKGQPHLVAQWANFHKSLARAWVEADPAHAAFLDHWVEEHQLRPVEDSNSASNSKATDVAADVFSEFF